MKIYWITKCTTTGYSFPLLFSLLKKQGRRKGEWISKTCLKQVILRIHPIFTKETVYFVYTKWKSSLWQLGSENLLRKLFFNGFVVNITIFFYLKLQLMRFGQSKIFEPYFFVPKYWQHYFLLPFFSNTKSTRNVFIIQLAKTNH